MGRRIVFETLLMLLVVSMSMLAFVGHVNPAGQTKIVPIDFPTIQEAVDNLGDGDTIYVIPTGEPYFENVTINKRLTVKRWPYTTPGDYPVVDGGNRNGAVFKVTASNVEISGFEIRNGKYGILLESSENIVYNNTVTLNERGIYIENQSARNTLTGNRMSSNTWNFGIADYGPSGNLSAPLEHFVQDIDESNTVDDKPICYLINQHNASVRPDAGYVAIINCTDLAAESLTSLKPNCQNVLVAYSSRITVRNLKCLYPFTGFRNGIVLVNVTDSTIQNVTFSDIQCESCIRLRHSDNNLVQGNHVIRSSVGVGLEYSNYNAIADNTFNQSTNGLLFSLSLNNTVVANTIYRNTIGMAFGNANGSMIYHNNFINTSSGVDIQTINSFNKFNNEYEGNYWSRYKGSDADGDGIGDSPHIIYSDNRDNYPLNETWSAQKTFTRKVKSLNPNFVQRVSTFSNSTLGRTSFSFNWSLKRFSLKATCGYSGFLNITIPRDWLDGPFNVSIDGAQTGYIFRVDAKQSSLFIAYEKGKHVINITGTEAGSFVGDLNGDGVINIFDVVMVTSSYGAKSDEQ